MIAESAQPRNPLSRVVGGVWDRDYIASADAIAIATLNNAHLVRAPPHV